MYNNTHIQSRSILCLHPLLALVLPLYQENQISLQFPLQFFIGPFPSSLLVSCIDVLYVIGWRVSIDFLEAIDDPLDLLLSFKEWSVVYVDLLQISHFIVGFV